MTEHKLVADARAAASRMVLRAKGQGPPPAGFSRYSRWPPLDEDVTSLADACDELERQLRFAPVSQVVSPRGYPLVLERVPGGDRLPTLAVELAPKWYSFFVVTAGDVVTEVPHGFACLQDFATPPYVDHVPNPRAVELYAEENGYYLDDLAYELIVGRWTREVLDV